MKRFLYIMFMSLLLMSCKAHEYVEVPIETIKTEYIYDVKVDSIHVKDSISNWIKGDTVFIYKEHTKYKYQNTTDTIMKTDTIPKIIEVKTKEVVEVNHVKWYQEALMWLGGVSILLLTGSIIYKMRIK